MSNEPTKKQMETLRFIVRRCDAGSPPSFDEMRREAGVGFLQAIADRISALERRGLVARIGEGIARNIRPTALGRQVAGLPAPKPESASVFIARVIDSMTRGTSPDEALFEASGATTNNELLAYLRAM